LILTLGQLLHFKIDYESLTVGLVSTTYVQVHSIVIDQLNERNFVVCGTFQFVTGSLVGDRLVFNRRVEYDVGFLIWSKLVGTRVSGFRMTRNYRDGVCYWQYCEIDLVALTEQTFEIPFDVNGQNPTDVRFIVNVNYVLTFQFSCYCWIENRLYALFGLGRDEVC
jgi:hypothetical protein